MRAATKNLDLGHGNANRPAGRGIGPERLPGGGRRGVHHGHRDGDGGVAAEPRLLRRAVEFDEDAVDFLLAGCIDAGQRMGDLAIDVGDGARHVEAAEPLAAVAQLERLARAGRRSGRGDGAATAPPDSRISASTVGRPRESHTRRPRTEAIDVVMSCPVSPAGPWPIRFG